MWRSLCVVLPLAIGCGGDFVAAESSTQAVATGPGSASAFVEHIRRTYRVARRRGLDVALPKGVTPPASERESVLLPSLVTSFSAVAGGLQPVFQNASMPIRTSLTFPASAAGTMTVQGVNLAVGIKLAGSTTAPAEEVDGYLVYLSSHLSGASAVNFATPAGTESFLEFAAHPPIEEIAYDVVFDSDVKGVRSIGGVVEFLDARGVPGVSISPPYIIDAEGAVTPIELSISGCVVDRDPHSPIERAVTPPGSQSCRLTLSWAGLGISYPALLDPPVSSPSVMRTPRYLHSATFIPPAGRGGSRLVLAVGGFSELGIELNSAELYTPNAQQLPSGEVIGVWTATEPLPSFGRAGHSGTLLTPSNTVLVAGGRAFPPFNFVPLYLDQALIYDVNTDFRTCTVGFPCLWSAAQSMPSPHHRHTATRLEDGRVLVAGGLSGGGFSPTPSADAAIFEPTTRTWTAVSPMSTPRVLHDAALLTNGTVLVAGGTANNADPLSSAERFDPATSNWLPASSLNTTVSGSRRIHAAS